MQPHCCILQERHSFVRTHAVLSTNNPALKVTPLVFKGTPTYLLLAGSSRQQQNHTLSPPPSTHKQTGSAKHPPRAHLFFTLAMQTFLLQWKDSVLRKKNFIVGQQQQATLEIPFTRARRSSTYQGCPRPLTRRNWISVDLFAILFCHQRLAR